MHEAAREGIDAVTSSMCIAEVWRDPARQARLARVLAGVIEYPLDPTAARACGVLLARSGTSEVADAAPALLAVGDDAVLTSDAGDIHHLLASSGSDAEVRSV